MFLSRSKKCFSLTSDAQSFFLSKIIEIDCNFLCPCVQFQFRPYSKGQYFPTMVTDGLLSQGYHNHKRFSKSNNQILREIHRSAILATNDDDDSLQFCDCDCSKVPVVKSSQINTKFNSLCNVQLQYVSTFDTFEIFSFAAMLLHQKQIFSRESKTRKVKDFIKQHFTLISSFSGPIKI